MYDRGLVPLSADPPTLGHLGFISDAVSRCNEVVVFVGNNGAKRGKYTFPLAQRAVMLRRLLDENGLSRVRIVAGNHLLVDVYMREDCSVVFRGVRNEEERAHEEQHMRIHKLIYPDIQVAYIPGDSRFHGVSSSMIKGFVRNHVDVSKWVPNFVRAPLEAALCEQWMVGVTGPIAAGKTYVLSEISQALCRLGLPGAVLNVDEIQRGLYTSPTPAGRRVRAEMAQHLGEDILTENGNALDRKLMMDRLTSPWMSGEDVTKPSWVDPHLDPNQVRARVREVVKPHILRGIREFRSGLKPVESDGTLMLSDDEPPTGLIFLEWGQLVEDKLTHWCNDNVVIIDPPPPDRQVYLEQRGVLPQVVDYMAQVQWSASARIAAVQALGGTALVFENSQAVPGIFPLQMETLIKRVIDEMHPSYRAWQESLSQKNLFATSKG